MQRAEAPLKRFQKALVLATGPETIRVTFPPRIWLPPALGPEEMPGTTVKSDGQISLALDVSRICDVVVSDNS